MKDLKTNISELINILRLRNNNAYLFFEKLIIELDEKPIEVLDSILKSYAIVQYSDFDAAEGSLFDKIWNLAEQLKTKY